MNSRQINLIMAATAAIFTRSDRQELTRRS